MRTEQDYILELQDESSRKVQITKRELDYIMELNNHKARIANKRAFLNQVVESVSQIGPEATLAKFNRLLDESLSMDAPNPPGYYRANND